MKSIKYITSIIVLLILISSCKQKQIEVSDIAINKTTKKNEISVSKKQFLDAKMELSSISEQDFPNTIRATGIINIPATSKEVISAFYGGNIKKFNLNVGDKVRKGQALVSIENPQFIDLQQEYLEIKEQINYLRSEYERQEILYKENIASKKVFYKAESDFKSKQSKLYGLRKKIELLNINVKKVEQREFVSSITIYSTINGIISELNISKGMRIVPEFEIMKIVNTDNIQIELSVFEKDILNVKKNQIIRFKIPEASDQYFDAKVYKVGRIIENETKTFRVIGHLENTKDTNFNIGMFVDAEIAVENKKRFSLPENAIIENENGFVVLKLNSISDDDYIFELINVKKGGTHNRFTEIDLKNIEKKDKFLTKGAYSLID